MGAAPCLDSIFGSPLYSESRLVTQPQHNPPPELVTVFPNFRTSARRTGVRRDIERRRVAWAARAACRPNRGLE